MPRAKPIARLATIAATILVGVAAVAIGGPWLSAWWSGVQANTRRSLSIGFLSTVLIAYVLVLILSVVAGTTAAIRLVSGRRMGKQRPMSARILLLSASSLMSLVMLESLAWGFGKWTRSPRPAPPIPATDLAVPEKGSSSELTLLVLGESSAEGQPFQPWFSIGHAIAWQIERATPGRRVRVEMAATGGVGIAHAVKSLASQKKRPDIVVLCSGHNEFQSRWPWSRAVNYYRDDVIARPREGPADFVGNWTPLCRFIRDTIDHQRLDEAPNPVRHRLLVDRPMCEPGTRADLARRFAADLETIAAWCEKAGAVPIFVIPAANDVGFEPTRSLMEPEATSAERKEFTDEFQTARDLDTRNPLAAMASYKHLIRRQPGFAESHYRLAQHLQAKGRKDEAVSEYDLARDLDGMPLRCPTEFQAGYHAVAAKHPMVLVRSHEVLRAISPSGMLDDNVFQDGHHPTFRGYLALAQDAINQLRAKRLFGLDRSDLPALDPTECATHFGLDESLKWRVVCERSEAFWKYLGETRYDPSARAERAAKYRNAIGKINAGITPEQAGVLGLGVKPAGFP